VTGYISRWFTRPQTVTHPRTNLAVHGRELIMSHWLLVRQCVRFVYWSTIVFTSSLLTSCRCQSSFSSLYTSPFALDRSGWPCCATDKNSWLWSA